MHAWQPLLRFLRRAAAHEQLRKSCEEARDHPGPQRFVLLLSRRNPRRAGTERTQRGMPRPHRWRRRVIEAARVHCQDFFPWYNDEHRHGGLGLHTAADICYGRAAAVRAGRAEALTAAYHAHPERFVRKPPAPPKLPGTSWINPPQDKETSTQ